jgi:hypothetical protein
MGHQMDFLMESLKESWMAHQKAKYSGTCWEYHLG